MKARHPAHGDSVAISCAPDRDDYLLAVAFMGAPGIKILMLSLASLELV